jgi:hypothetical protein
MLELRASHTRLADIEMRAAGHSRSVGARIGLQSDEGRRKAPLVVVQRVQSPQPPPTSARTIVPVGGPKPSFEM